MAVKNLQAVVQRRRVFRLPDGQTVELAEPTLRDWGQIEEEATHAAKRDMILTWQRNADLLPEAIRDQKLIEVFERAERLRPDTLPTVFIDVPVSVGGVVQTGSDGKAIKESVPVGYAHWWLSRTMAGRLFAVWLSVRRASPGMTLDQVSDLFARYDEATLDDAAQTVGELAVGPLGNVPAPETAGQQRHNSTTEL